MQKTIIHIFSLPLYDILKVKSREEIERQDYVEYLEISEAPFCLALFKGDFPEILAKETLKRTSEYKVEFWRTYPGIKKAYSKSIEGVLHRVFPAKKNRFSKIDLGYRSPQLIAYLQQKIKDKEKILLHFHGLYPDLLRSILFNIKPGNTPVLCQHRGGSFSIREFYKKKIYFWRLFNYLKELHNLKKIDYYFACAKEEQKIMAKKLGKSKVGFFMDGEDFENFRPAADRGLLRKQYGFSNDSIILLYVGKFYRLKGVDNTLEAFLRLRQRHKGLVFIAIGGRKEDELYGSLEGSSVYVIERVPRHQLIPYYQMADIYLMPSFDDYFVNFCGFGSAPIQALACGVPVISRNLINFPGSEDEISKIGLMPKDKSELDYSIEYIMNHRENFRECREIARRYFDVNLTIRTLINKYDELFEQHYGK
jgi:glycosyltransferase involved in cell wall biosynthesis